MNVFVKSFHFEKQGKNSHYPFASRTKGDDIVEIFQNGSVLRYRSDTSQGMSGGSIELDGKIYGKTNISWLSDKLLHVLGIHNAGDEEEGFSNGLLFTTSLRDWMIQIFSKWADLNLVPRNYRLMKEHNYSSIRQSLPGFKKC